MKKWIALFLALCLCCALLPVMAEDAPANIAGTWKMTKYIVGDKTVDDPEAAGSKKMIVFSEDGTARVTINSNVYAATWTLEGDTVHLLYEDGDKGDFTVEPEQLVYKTGNQVQYFSRLEVLSRGLGDVKEALKRYSSTYQRPVYKNNRLTNERLSLTVPKPPWILNKNSQSSDFDEYYDSEDLNSRHYALGIEFADEVTLDDEDIDAIKDFYLEIGKNNSLVPYQYFEINGHPAYMFTNTEYFDEGKYDQAIVFYLRKNHMIALTYTRMLRNDEDEGLYQFDPQDLLDLATKIKVK